MRLMIGLIALAFTFAAGSALAAPEKNRLENTLYLTLTYGQVVIKLRPDLAPKHVERVKKLVREGFYNGVPFHRVIDGFMAQSGDPTGTGMGGSNYPDLPAEFTKTPFIRGTVAAARGSELDSANSQFFICFESVPGLNGRYTVWGNVLKGMRFVDLIKKGAPGSGTVKNPDKIVKIAIAADVLN